MHAPPPSPPLFVARYGGRRVYRREARARLRTSGRRGSTATATATVTTGDDDERGREEANGNTTREEKPGERRRLRDATTIADGRDAAAPCSARRTRSVSLFPPSRVSSSSHQSLCFSFSFSLSLTAVDPPRARLARKERRRQPLTSATPDGLSRLRPDADDKRGMWLARMPAEDTRSR